MSTVFLYDGTVNGVFTVIAKAIKQHIQPDEISPKGKGQGALFADELFIQTDDEQVDKLWGYLNRDLTESSVQRILATTLCGESGWEIILHDYIKLSLKLRKEIDNYHTYFAVKSLHEIANRVGFETHRFQGLLRFRELKNEMLYAPFNPDHRIVYPLSLHFKDRLASEKWIIHDIAHNEAVFWDGNETQDIEFDQEFLDSLTPDGKISDQWLSADEKQYQQLWQNYFKNIAIKARENKKLQRQFMPKRYWTYLTEL